MQQEQIKKIIINGLAVLVILGVVITGYRSFTGGDTQDVTAPGTSVVSQVAEETRLIGAEIDSTVRELKGLDSALENSVAIFDLPAFTNLQDFSVSIPEQPVGRDNPFVPTLWKIQIKPYNDVSQKTDTPSAERTQTSSTPESQQASGALININPGI